MISRVMLIPQLRTGFVILTNAESSAMGVLTSYLRDFYTGAPAADFVAQARQALANIVAVLAEAGAAPEHVVRMTWYVIDKREYMAAYPQLGRAYREVIGRNFPAMTAVQVAGLMEDAARVEIEATAVIPD
jgi:enamine deaminase RidA (YjgF/YER057c/UK114 family)